MLSAKTLGLTVVGNSGGHSLVLCPFHNDRRPSAWYNERKGMFYCAVCGFGVNQVELARKMGLDPDLIADMEAEVDDYEPPDFSLIPDDVSINWYGSKGYHPYFEVRGITANTAQLYGMRYHENPEAVAFPIMTPNGTFLIGSVVRYIDTAKTGTRYKKYGKITPYWPREHNKDVAIICEGGFSAMRMSKYRNEEQEFCYAMFGARCNQELIDATWHFDKVVFLYDDDIAGERACHQMRKLNPTANSYTLSKAPDDMSTTELTYLWDKIRRVIYE